MAKRSPEQVLEAWRAAFAAANGCTPPTRGAYSGGGRYSLGTSKRYFRRDIEEMTERPWTRARMNSEDRSAG